MKWKRALKAVVWTCLALCLAYGTSNIHAQRLQTINTVTLSVPLTKAEGKDYATLTWGNPWDMSQQADVFIPVSTCPDGPVSSGFSGVTVSNGLWEGTTTTSGPAYFWLLNPGYSSSLDMGQDGQLRPIDTSKYKWLSFKVYSSASTNAVFYWAQGDLSGPPFTVSSLIPVSSGWNIYMIDMSKFSWTGNLTGLRFDPALNSGRTIKVDWVRLSEQQAGDVVAWTGTGLSGNVAIAFDDSTGTGYARLRYFPNGAAEQAIPATALSFTVPASLAPGTYRAQVTELNTSSSATSGNQWTFKPVPIAKIVAPSYISGPDFATVELGNPWDMDSTGDIDAAYTENLTYGVSDGILDIVSTVNSGDICEAAHLPLALNQGGKWIDSSKYKYLTYVYRADGAPDQGSGGMMRVRWQNRDIHPSWPTGRTDDISFYHNQWETYKIDLSTVRKEGEMADWNFPIQTFQLMAHERRRPWTTHLDWVRLTGENTATSSYTVRWNLENVDSSGVSENGLGYSSEVTTTIYWATKSDSTYTLVGSGFSVPTVPPTITYTLPYSNNLFLPVALRNLGPGGDSALASQFEYQISASGLASGSYYVALKLEDGYNVAWWYSELSVIKP